MTSLKRPCISSTQCSLETRDLDGISIAANSIDLNGGTIRDKIGINAVLTHSALAADSTRKVDAAPPTVSSVALTSSPTTGDTYTVGETITARATFQEDLTLTGQPQLTLTIGANTRTATYSASSGKTVDFTYTVQASDKDSDGISIAADSLSLNGATIQDSVGHNATLSHTALTAQSSHKVNGATHIQNVFMASKYPAGSSYYADGSRLGWYLTMRVDFSANVSGDVANLVLPLQLDSGLVYATYHSHVGRLVVYSYKFTSTDRDLDGFIVPANSIRLSSGTMTDDSNATVDLNHPAYTFPNTGRVSNHLLDETLRITHDSNGGCLDVKLADAYDGQWLWTFDCNSTDAQKWVMERRSDGTQQNKYRLVSKLANSAYCLDNAASVSGGHPIHMWNCHGNSHEHVAFQSFDLENVNGNRYRIVFQDTNGKTYMNAAGTLAEHPDVKQSATASDNGIWRIEPHP